MTGLGERLKEARNAKGYTLEDLQEITKIQKRYLIGIENEEYGSMPGTFYVRAFIKQYAEAVDLDVNEMLALYQGGSGVVEPAVEERKLTQPTIRKRSARSSGQLAAVMPKIYVAVFIIIVLVVMMFLWKNNPSRQAGPEKQDGNSSFQLDEQKKEDTEKKPAVKDEENEKPAEKPKEEPEEEPEEEDEPEKQILTHVSNVGADSTYTLSNASEFKLEIRTAEDSWIGVLDASQVERTDGARVMTKGEKVELDVSDTESVRIRVARTGSTEIYVNGELLEYATDTAIQNIIIEYEKEE